MEHPAMPGFYQCVTFAFFPTPGHEKAYNLFCLLALYGVPLAAIVTCYGRILWEIHRQSRDSHDDQSTGAESNHGRLRLRRSDVRHIERARNRTLRLTIVIVLAFFLCWTPYVIMVLWYQFDPEGAEHVDGYLQSSLFMFAVSNSCVNPLVYGSYTATFEKRCCGQTTSWCWVLGNVRCKENYKLSKQPSKQTVNSWVTRTPQCQQRELQKDWCSACSSEVYDLRSVLDKNEAGYCQSHVELTRSTTKLCRCSVDSVVLVLPSAKQVS
ncbi:gonadotropin-releasing hormone II receptor [Ixodes scapularis]